jgi:hypothetical protein
MTMLERVDAAIYDRVSEYDGLAGTARGELAYAAVKELIAIAKEGGTHLDPVVYEHAELFLEAILTDTP